MPGTQQAHPLSFNLVAIDALKELSSDTNLRSIEIKQMTYPLEPH